MKPQLDSLNFTFERDAGAFLIYTFVLNGKDPDQSLRKLLETIAVGAELLFDDPQAGDCYLEVRKTEDGFETKRGCHGAHGTWRKASIDDAFNWLLPGALAADQGPLAKATLYCPKGAANVLSNKSMEHTRER
jgi:hypothetical protein